MENKKIITILLAVIIIAFIILIFKVIAKPNVNTPLLSYDNKLNVSNNIVNDQINSDNQISLVKNVVINRESKKTSITSNNYNQTNPIKENIDKKQSSSPKVQITNNQNQINITQNTVEQKEIEKVAILEHQMKNKYISGIVKNNTNQSIKELKITADYYDEDNNKLSTAIDFLTTGLEPNETWKFEMYTSSKAVTYKNLKVTYK